MVMSSKETKRLEFNQLNLIKHHLLFMQILHI